MDGYLLCGLKYLWAFPNTTIGLSFIPLTLASGGRVRVERGANRSLWWLHAGSS